MQNAITFFMFGLPIVPVCLVSSNLQFICAICNLYNQCRNLQLQFTISAAYACTCSLFGVHLGGGRERRRKVGSVGRKERITTLIRATIFVSIVHCFYRILSNFAHNGSFDCFYH